MINFRRMRIWERILDYVWLSRQLKRQRRIADAIKHLVENPHEPCSIDGIILPDGFGSQTYRPEDSMKGQGPYK